MTDITPAIQELHSAYCDSTKMSIELTMSRIFQWQAWQARGWGKAELRLVVQSLHRKIAAGKKWASALTFRRLIGDLEGFEEELADARALARRPRPGAREAVLRATGRGCPSCQNTARRIRDIVAEQKALAALRALKESL